MSKTIMKGEDFHVIPPPPDPNKTNQTRSNTPQIHYNPFLNTYHLNDQTIINKRTNFDLENALGSPS